MRTSVTKRGQTVIPAVIRKRDHIHEGDQITWLDDCMTTRVVATAADPIHALHGQGKGERLVERLLATRQADRNDEHWALCARYIGRLHIDRG